MLCERVVVVVLCVALLTGCSRKTKEELLAEGIEQITKNPNGAIVLLKNALEKDQNFTEARYQLAKAYVKSGKLDQAEKEYQKVILQDPTRGDISLRLAEIYIDTNRLDLALTETDKYLGSHTANAEALEIKGRILAKKGAFDEAERFLLQALAADDTRLSARLTLASVNIYQGREADARKVVSDILQRDSRNTKAYYLLASLEARGGDRERAIQTYKAIAEIEPSDFSAPFQMGMMQLDGKEFGKAETIADDLTSRFPNRPEGYLLKGLVQYHKKDFSKAITSFQTSLKFHSGTATYYYLGLSHYYRGEYETGISQMRKVLDVNPNMDQARLMTAIMLLKLKRADDAISEARKVISRDDTNALAHNILGSALLEKGQIEEGMRELEKATSLDPKLVDAHLKKGLVSLSKGKIREGEAELESAVRVAPDILKTRFLLASYYMKQQKAAAAIRVLREGLTGGANDVPLYNAMAAPLFSQKNTAEALKVLQKAKTLNPDSPAAYLNLASYHALQRDYDKALAEFRALQSRDPSNLAALVGTARIYEAKGDTAQALASYRKAAASGNPSAFVELARFHLKQNDSASALRVLDDAVKKAPKNETALEMRGAIQLKEKRFKEAIASFEQLRAGNEAKALPLLVAAYSESGDSRKAEDAARKIMANNPRSASGYAVLASVYEKNKNVQRAIDTLKEGVGVDPKNVQVRMLLGGLYARNKEYADAMKTFAGVRQINPAYVPALYQEGTIHELMGNRTEALKKYREVLSHDKNHVPALNNLAFLYADAPKMKGQALEMASRAFKLQPNNGAILDTYGYVLFKNGKISEAATTLEKAATQLPRNPTVQYHLALVQKSAGDNIKAKKTAQRALALGDFPEAAKTRQLLSEL
jgi:putative PEP-CTERM system TPR-repeat lipoprotein